MDCLHCGKEIESSDKFCRHCGKAAGIPSGGINITEGDNSFHGGQGNIYTDNEIHVAVPQDPREVAYIDRLKVKPLRVGSHPVRVSWLLLSGSIGLIGSIASIYSAFGSSFQFLGLLLGALSMMSLAFGGALWRFRFARFPPFFNLEASESNEVYLTQIGGTCPKCSGKLKLREIGPKNNKKTFVRCTRNPDHLWGFDPTVLGEVSNLTSG